MFEYPGICYNPKTDKDIPFIGPINEWERRLENGTICLMMPCSWGKDYTPKHLRK